MFDDLIKWLESVISAIYKFFTDLVVSVWETIRDFVLDVSYYIYNMFLSIFETMITSIPIPSSWDTSSIMSSMPVQTLYILYEIGFLQALAIILSAWLIRLLINLIPSWATRA